MKLLFSFVLLLVIACERPASKVTTRRATNLRPWYLTPSEQCQFDSGSVHPDPIRLVRDYVDRDARGQFLQSDSWFDAAVTCPGHEPGADAFVVVRSYQIAFDTLPGDTVRARVSYQVLGLLGGGTHFELDTTTHIRTLKLTDGPFGWRIESPAINQHVRLEAALKLRWLPDSLKERLRSLAKSRGA